MNLLLEKITIIKHGFKGEASIKFDGLAIKKIIIDNSSAVSPISIPKYDGTIILSGKIIDELKEQILYFFQDLLSDAEDGIYEFEQECEFKVSKLD